MSVPSRRQEVNSDHTADEAAVPTTGCSSRVSRWVFVMRQYDRALLMGNPVGRQHHAGAAGLAQSACQSSLADAGQP